MLENIFAAGDDTRLSSLKNRFYTAVPVIRHDIMSALKTKGVTCSIQIPPTVTARRGDRDSRPFGVLQYSAGRTFFNSPLAADCLHRSRLVIWWLFAREMTAKTVKGARTRIAVSDFRNS